MIDKIKKEAGVRMGKSIESLQHAFNRLRTGRANPSLLEGIEVAYYGSDMPINQVANVIVEDARTLLITPWEKNMLGPIEKAILKSDIGITPANSGDNIRVPLPPLTEQNRKDLARQAKQESENARVAIRNIRRDAIAEIRELTREKELAEDDGHRGEDEVQVLTDHWVKEVDTMLGAKEAEL
ncbi:MAG: ribosome recycling factor, partial [Proteobacteria bacterium]|nr:ribosome recycling factor [Pseudomonadota bacterium]